MNMGGMNMGGMILGFIIGIVGLALFPVYADASDTLYREFVPRCQLADQSTTLVLTVADPTGIPGGVAGTHMRLVATGTTCTGVLTGSTAAGTMLTESDNAIPVAWATGGIITVTGGTWVSPARVVTRFGAINQLLASILPLMIALSFLSTGFLAGRRMGQGMNLQDSIGKEIMLLVLAIVAIFLLPSLIDFLSAAGAVTDGSLTVTSRFGSIIDLVLGVVPLLFVIAVMGIGLKSGYESFKTFKNEGARGGGGMMNM